MAALPLQVDRVGYRYGARRALDGVTFTVEPGELFGLLGPIGGGTTTLLRLVTTLIPPDEGRVCVAGHDTVEEPAAVRRQLGVVFQQPALDAELTVRENLRAHGALVGLGRRELDERIAWALDRLGLADRAGERVRTLSGGLARRADLARGLLHRPPLLLLDEPTTGLDPTARRELWTALGRLRREAGTTIIVATHLMEEAERCDRVGILDRGRLVALGAPAELTAELGTEALWLETPDPADLAERLEARLGLRSRVVGEALLVEADDAPAVLARVYAAFPGAVAAATVRRPTLDDVFAARTGSSFAAEDLLGTPAA
ncbi:MAG: ATP-binding cassette domain-containing protein [Rhodothermales bacterium]|nr:ATP-binding cassette domain-containing protein [Rhodothermales bacterium]